MSQKILVTGAFGLVGTNLVEALQKKYGVDAVIAQGHSKIPDNFKGILETADVREKSVLEAIIKKYNIFL